MRHVVVVALFGWVFSSAYATGSEDCAKRVAQFQEINLTAGLYTERAVVSSPLKIRLPVGTDGDALAACLRLEGFDPAERMAAAVSNSGDCRNAARKTHLIKASDQGGTRIASAVDEAVYRDCLQNDIDVEVLLPASAN